MKNLLYTLTALLLTLHTHLAFADDGTEGGGGGDAVILPSGEVVLADAFLDHTAPQPNHMPPRKSLNPRLLRQIGAYQSLFERGVLGTRAVRVSESVVLRELRRLAGQGAALVYYSVASAEELNNFCASGGRKHYLLPSGARVEQVACTAGDETFIVTPLFSRMNLHHQALLLIHERLTTIRDAQGSKNFQAIARLTTGLGVYLQLAYEQQTGARRALAPSELRQVLGLYEGLAELEYRDGNVPDDAFTWRLHPNGAGLLHPRAQVEADAWVGVTSSVGQDAVVGARTRLTGVHLAPESVLAEDVILTGGAINARLHLGAGSVIEDSRIIASVLTAGPGLLMRNSHVDVSDVTAVGWRIVSHPRPATFLPQQHLVGGRIVTEETKDLLPVDQRLVTFGLTGSIRPRGWQSTLATVTEDLRRRVRRSRYSSTLTLAHDMVHSGGWVTEGTPLRPTTTQSGDGYHGQFTLRWESGVLEMGGGLTARGRRTFNVYALRGIDWQLAFLDDLRREVPATLHMLVEGRVVRASNVVRTRQLFFTASALGEDEVKEALTEEFRRRGVNFTQVPGSGGRQLKVILEGAQRD